VAQPADLDTSEAVELLSDQICLVPTNVPFSDTRINPRRMHFLHLYESVYLQLE
jgi:hypothetical protein